LPSPFAGPLDQLVARTQANAAQPLNTCSRDRDQVAYWEISILKSQVRWLAWGRFGVIGLVDRWFGSS
jgi:hypothetical protein